METAILAFGTIGFWLVSSLAIILMLTCINFKKGAGATVVAIGAALMFQFWGGIDIYGYVKHNPMNVVYFALGYGAIGALTSIGKWWRYCVTNARKYQEAKAEFQDDGGNLEDWPKYRESGNYHGIRFIFEPMARRHKAVITMWMTYWPLVLIWTLIDDPVRRFFQIIYEKLGTVLERISKSAFKNVDDDLPAKARRKVGSLDDVE